MVIQHSTEIKGSLKQVYALARDVYSHPEYMPDLKSVKVVECSEDGCRIVSEFVGIIKELKTDIKWTAEDIWDDQSNTCRFSVIKSGAYSYSGVWRFTDMGDQTKFDSEIEIECDLPVVGIASIKRLVARRVEANIANMLEMLKAQVAS